MLNDILRSPSSRHESATRTVDVVRDLVGQTAAEGASVSVFAGTAGDLVYATDEVATEIDELQFVLGEGPTVECFRRRHPQVHHGGAGVRGTHRWPTFAADIAALDVRTVHAFPLAADSVPLGVLTLCGTRPRALTSRQEKICTLYARSLVSCVLADLAGVPYLATGPYGFSRADVHVASGILAARHTISIEQALGSLQSQAYTQQRRITEVAREIIANFTTAATT